MKSKGKIIAFVVIAVYLLMSGMALTLNNLARRAYALDDGTFTYEQIYNFPESRYDIVITGLTEAHIADTDVSVPASINGIPVSSIGATAFQFRNELKTITLPPNVTSISSGAFNGCTSLASIDMPNVTSISSGAFNDIEYQYLPYDTSEEAGTKFNAGDFVELYSGSEIYVIGFTPGMAIDIVGGIAGLSRHQTQCDGEVGFTDSGRA